MDNFEGQHEVCGVARRMMRSFFPTLALGVVSQAAPAHRERLEKRERERESEGESFERVNARVQCDLRYSEERDRE
jgi:hypothetical protein